MSDQINKESVILSPKQTYYKIDLSNPVVYMCKNTDILIHIIWIHNLTRNVTTFTCRLNYYLKRYFDSLK